MFSSVSGKFLNVTSRTIAYFSFYDDQISEVTFDSVSNSLMKTLNRSPPTFTEPASNKAIL